MVLKLAAFIMRFDIIIDWHNFGYSIMALQMGREHWAVKLANWYEHTVGRTAYAHLTVTQAMR